MFDDVAPVYLQQADKDEEDKEERRGKEQAIKQNLSEDIIGLRYRGVSGPCNPAPHGSTQPDGNAFSSFM